MDGHPEAGLAKADDVLARGQQAEAFQRVFFFFFFNGLCDDDSVYYTSHTFMVLIFYILYCK